MYLNDLPLALALAREFLNSPIVKRALGRANYVCFSLLPIYACAAAAVIPRRAKKGPKKEGMSNVSHYSLRGRSLIYSHTNLPRNKKCNIKISLSSERLMFARSPLVLYTYVCTETFFPQSSFSQRAFSLSFVPSDSDAQYF